MAAKSIQTVTLFPGTNLLWKNVRSAENLAEEKKVKPKLYCITPDCGYEKVEEE